MPRHRAASRGLTACGIALAAVGIAGALLRSQAPGPEIPAGSNVLLGRVADARTEQPVAGAVVTLTGYFDPSGKPLVPAETGPPQGASAPRSVITSADGLFFFRNLPAAKYSVVADAFGYINASYPLKIIELNNGDRPAPVQLYVTKFAAISGTVLDEHGEPLAGVPVLAMQRVMSGGSLVLRTARQGNTTDDRGIYRIARLPPGNYIVGVVSESLTLPAAVAASIEARARYPGFPLEELLPSGVVVATGDGMRVGDSVVQRSGPAPPPPSADGRMLAYATTFGPGTTLPSEATVITLGSGDQRNGADIALRLSPAVRVSGVATSPSGPMKSLAIRLLPPGASDTADTDPKGAATAVTDANGAFTFPAVTPGPYILRAAYNDQAASPNIPNSADISLWASQPLTVADTDITGLAVTLRAGLRVSGHAEFKGATEAPPTGLQGTVLMLRPVGASLWRTSRAFVAADGLFTIPGDPPGRYVVYARPPQGWTWQTITRGGKTVMDDVIELDSGDLSGLVLTFSKESNRIAGSIIDAAGASAADADVTVFPADSTLWREGIINNRRVRSVHATSTAAFVISDLAPGDYYIAAVGSRFVTDAADPLFLERIIPGATKLTLGEGETKTIQLKTFTPRDK